MLALAIIILLAFLLDLILGDPRYRLHPIRLMGRCIGLLTRILKRVGLGGKKGGILLTAMMEFLFFAAFLTVHLLFHEIYLFLGLAFDLFVCYSCLALKDLVTHTELVTRALERGNLPDARAGVAMVVGRDVQFLDEKGISRAAIETLAENFVDGFLSPLFWYLTGGILGYLLGFTTVTAAMVFMIAFKVASTLDSMVGYKDSEFLEFGWASAKLDDIMNFFPARLSLPVLFAGAWISNLKAIKGIKTALRDRLKHASPNSAHAESFVAGALNIRLGGPTVYPTGEKDKPWLGEGNPDPSSSQIRQTASMLIRTAWLAVSGSIILLILLTL
ncbi:MAG TPA: cobalamin biosynthesis protein CobD [Deltaproteobacteria bacterium]|nr:cobalamin biosynthesis protein CobD [Deltaproteobacteria bacterium]